MNIGEKFSLLFLLFLAMFGFSYMGTARAATEGSSNVGMRYQRQATPYYLQEGDGPGREFFNVQCSSDTGTWTVLKSSNSTSRAVLFQAIPTNSGSFVCISSTSMTGACSATTSGFSFIAPGASLTDYSGSGWSCASQAGFGDRIVGYRSRHSQDSN